MNGTAHPSQAVMPRANKPRAANAKPRPGEPPADPLLQLAKQTPCSSTSPGGSMLSPAACIARPWSCAAVGRRTAAIHARAAEWVHGQPPAALHACARSCGASRCREAADCAAASSVHHRELLDQLPKVAFFKQALALSLVDGVCHFQIAGSRWRRECTQFEIDAAEIWSNLWSMCTSRPTSIRRAEGEVRCRTGSTSRGRSPTSIPTTCAARIVSPS